MSAPTETSYRDLKQEVEEAKSAADKAQGALETLLERLKTEFDCKTVKEAKQRLVELETEKEEAATAYTKAMTAYEKRWHAVEAE